MIDKSDEYFMKIALQEAKKAYLKNEIPVGAVVVANGEVIARGYNQVETLNDPTAHAEMIAITSACNNYGSKVLSDCVLYISLEPCEMCRGAIINARIKKVVYAASDRNAFKNKRFIDDFFKHHVSSGIMEEEASELIDSFFEDLRSEE